MGYECKDCGNTEKFEANANDFTSCIIDGKGNYIEALEHDNIGFEIIEDSISCHKCGSHNIVKEKEP